MKIAKCFLQLSARDVMMEVNEYRTGSQDATPVFQKLHNRTLAPGRAKRQSSYCEGPFRCHPVF